ncbi:hypothetical protein BDV36DRAFT_266426, partial [Aspergillus pseudocaelatus]
MPVTTEKKIKKYPYNDQFALNNRRCFFLVDYGESQNDDDVPVLSYEWKETLCRVLFNPITNVC